MRLPALLLLSLAPAVAGATDMELVDWGDGAGTTITGTPLNFFLWIMQQLGKAL